MTVFLHSCAEDARRSGTDLTVGCFQRIEGEARLVVQVPPGTSEDIRRIQLDRFTYSRMIQDSRIEIVEGGSAPELFALGDVYILPSKPENIVSTTVQALESGLALIVTRDGPISEYVTQGVNGWLVKEERHDLRTWFDDWPYSYCSQEVLTEAMQFFVDNPTVLDACKKARKPGRRKRTRKMRKAGMGQMFDMIYKRTPFSLMRFSDGEVFVMDGKKRFLTMDKVVIPGEPTRLGNRLKQMLVSDDGVYKGIILDDLPNLPFWIPQYAQQFVRKEDSHVVSSGLWWPREEFLGLFQNIDEGVVLFANEDANVSLFPLPVKEFYRVPTQGIQFFEKHEEDFVGDVRRLAREHSNTLFVVSAGMLANVVCYEGWRQNKTNRYIDVGAVLDEQLFGMRDR